MSDKINRNCWSKLLYIFQGDTEAVLSHTC